MSWWSHRERRVNPLVRRVIGDKNASFLEKMNASKERQEFLRTGFSKIGSKISILKPRKTNFEEKARKAREIQEKNRLLNNTKSAETTEKQKATRVNEKQTSVIKKVNYKLSKAFVKKVRGRANAIYERIEKNQYLTPTKRKTYINILDFTVSSIIEDAKSIRQYEEELIEKKYPPEYVKMGVNWFIELTK